MNIFEMLLNYLDISKFLVILTVILIISVTYLLLSSDASIISGALHTECKIVPITVTKNPDTPKEINEGNKNTNLKIMEEKTVEIKGYHQNEIKENEKKFVLSDKKENVDQLSQKLIDGKNNVMTKNDELSIMFIESLSSLNSWKNNELGNKLFKEINWNLEKRQDENDDEESLVYQYVFPHLKIKDTLSSITNPNLSSSQSSVNSNSDTEDGEEEKEKALLSVYKLGICRTFECTEQNKLKSNIVKEVNGCFYKVYSQGDPYLIKEKCRKETIPENYNEMVDIYKKGGYDIISICGKKMKMNYIQSQRIERSKCESNMIFLGFVVYKVNYDDYKNAYS